MSRALEIKAIILHNFLFIHYIIGLFPIQNNYQCFEKFSGSLGIDDYFYLPSVLR